LNGSTTEQTVAVVGLGYVGLPLAAAFGRVMPTVGFDADPRKVEALRGLVDPTGELPPEELRAAKLLEVTADPGRMREADFVVVAVPTPIDGARQPDLGPVRSASRSVGENLKPGAVVIFESTVYPGVTEEVCVPILEEASGMVWRKEFHVGYSPERINPGDREHTLSRIVKVVAGDDEETLERVASLYERVVEAGVFRAGSIRVAEAAKVIENTQRDLNIALVNELAVIFDRLGIDTMQVLEAAGTKWNFLPFRPGLVGGHCIGVDPYYLTYKAESVGYHPEVILAGRRVNDNMGKFIAENTVKMMIRAGQYIRGARVGILGLTFKEDCGDLRNSRVVDIVAELRSYEIETAVHDPLADSEEAQRHYGITLEGLGSMRDLAALILAVPHRAYREMPVEVLLAGVREKGCVIDVKSVLEPGAVEKLGLGIWRL